jgi:hypothetical protein
LRRFITYTLYHIQIIKSRKMMVVRQAGIRKEEDSHRILVRKPEGKRPLGRPRRMWVDNIEMDLRGIGWDGMS